MKKSEICVFSCSIYIVLSLFCSHVTAADFSSVPTIALDEVRADMDAYCLTVLSGTEVQRYPLKVLSVVRGYRPGQNMILVVGTDEKFQHAGAIHGCSGSPVYIDGRLAGALAAGWDGSLDALYLVRPISDMLQVGSVETAASTPPNAVSSYDFSQPLDLKAVYQQSMDRLSERGRESGMLIPLSSSLPAQTSEAFGGTLRKMGFMPVSSPIGLPSSGDADSFKTGGVLAVVLCGGDVSLAATGTVTEIFGDQVFGFGHSFEGQGPVNFPIAAGVVHTVVASRESSFKFSSPGPILGTLEYDQSFAVRGTIGKQPKTIPLTIHVDRDNAPETHTYNCTLASDRSYTPMILQLVLNGAALLTGPLQQEHTVRYEAAVAIKGREPLVFSNMTSGQSTSDLEQSLYSVASLALNNPFEELEIESIDASIAISATDRTVSIQAVDVSQVTVRPGQTIELTVTLKSFRSEEFTTELAFKVPDNLAAGTYPLQVMGAAGYQRVVSNLAPQRFRAVDADSLVAALRRLTAMPNDGLYAVMPVPATGIVMRQHELPQLPQTKMLLMQDPKRIRPVSAWQTWAEARNDLDRIVQGVAEIELTVEP